MMYVYSFVVWPDETRSFGRALFDYFRVFRRRTEMRFTEAEFDRFRAEMNADGFTLRECVRAPFADPESVP